MNILVERYEHGKDYTLSRFYIDGVPYGFGVEDEYRRIKVMHETRIPDGVYVMELVDSPHFSGSYKVNKDFRIIGTKELLPAQAAEFHNFHKLIHVKDIPGFGNVLWHWGNTDDDTSGCYIVGSKTAIINGQSGVSESRKKYMEIYPVIAKAIANSPAGSVKVQYKSINFDASKFPS